MGKESNALKTGVYARAVLLPWENGAEFDQLHSEFFADLCPQGRVEEEIVEHIIQNRWMRRRLQQTTAIATHRHGFGKELERAQPASWREAVCFVRERDVDRHRILVLIDQKITEATKVVAKASEVAAEPAEELPRFVRILAKLSKQLTACDKSYKQARDFFLEYLPKHAEARIKIECQLDAQLDKLRGRLVIEQEARIRRGKLEMEVMTDALTKGMLDAARAPINEETAANAPARGKDAARAPVNEQNARVRRSKLSMKIAGNVLARSKHAAPVPGEDEPDPFAEFVKGGIDEGEVRRDEVDRKPSQA